MVVNQGKPDMPIEAAPVNEEVEWCWLEFLESRIVAA